MQTEAHEASEPQAVDPVVVDGALRGDGRVDVLLQEGALHQGYGHFESLRLTEGRIPFFARHHARLVATAAALALPVPPSEAVWLEDVRLLSTALGVETTSMRWLWFGEGGAGRRVVAKGPSTVAGSRRTRAVLRPFDPRWQRPFPELKTFAWLPARRALAAVGADEEPLFTDAEGGVLEGATCNILGVRGQEIATARPEAGVLRGVGRDVVLDCARELELTVRGEAPQPTDWTLVAVSAGRGVVPLTGGATASPETEATIVALAERFARRQEQESRAL